jgi:hypothetical protein
MFFPAVCKAAAHKKEGKLVERVVRILHHPFGTVAQLVEHLPEEQSVVGSTPTRPAELNIAAVAQLEERLLETQEVIGSNPIRRTLVVSDEDTMLFDNRIFIAFGQ